MADVKKVVLAYSGGLDTSVILRWLQETYRCEVVTFTADLGQGEELEPARKKAELLGVKEIFIDDLREEFVRDFVLPMFRANALYEGQYLLGTSIARPLIAKRQIEIARQTGADAVARMGPDVAHPAHRVRRPAPDPDRPGQARRGAVLGRREPASHLGRGQNPGRPVGRTRGIRVQPHRGPRTGARPAAIPRN